MNTTIDQAYLAGFNAICKQAGVNPDVFGGLGDTEPLDKIASVIEPSCEQFKTAADDSNRPQDGRGEGRGVPGGNRQNRNNDDCPDGGPGNGNGGGRGNGTNRKNPNSDTEKKPKSVASAAGKGALRGGAVGAGIGGGIAGMAGGALGAGVGALSAADGTTMDKIKAILTGGAIGGLGGGAIGAVGGAIPGSILGAVARGATS